MSLDPWARFAYCPRCGRPAAAANPLRCPSCHFVLYFNVASAVAAFVVDDEGRVLYTRRARDPGKGRLGMPGGFVDFGETAEEALRREVIEEVGLTLGDPTYLASFPNRYTYAGVTYTTLDCFFVARATDVRAARPLDAIASLEWTDPRMVDPREIAFESMRQALACYLGGPAR